MKSAKYVEDNIELLKYRNEKLKNHQNRIKKIMNQDTKTTIKQKTDRTRDAILENKLKIHNIISQQRETSIMKENSQLFNKLIDISMGKRSNMPFVKKKKSKHNISQSPLRSLPSLKPLKEEMHSLNYVIRKHEKERIEKDNLKLAAKLVSEHSELSKSKLNHDYQRIVEYKKRLRRVQRKSATPKKTKLPPLNKRESIAHELNAEVREEEERMLEETNQDDNIKIEEPSSQNLNTVETAQTKEESNKHEVVDDTKTNEDGDNKSPNKKKKQKSKKKTEEDSKSVRRQEKISKRYRDQSPGKQKMSEIQSKYLFEIYKSDGNNQQTILKKKKNKKRINKTTHLRVNSDDIDIDGENEQNNNLENQQETVEIATNDAKVSHENQEIANQ